MGRVIVVGSLNVDLVVTVAKLPGPGETVAGGRLARHQGGKGGNQAVAAARLGAQVVLIGAVGRDEMGDSAVDALRAEGVATEHIARVDRPTGVALIVVDAGGQNQIAVAPGANEALDASAATAALEAVRPGPGDVVLASREVPDGAIRAALARARSAGATTILNPAPADALEHATAGLADYLTPNEHELEAISGSANSAEGAHSVLSSDGTRWLAVTLGSAGAMLVERDGEATQVPAPQVDPVDTTGAGDTFNGALAALLAAGRPVLEAVAMAVTAASLSTLRAGAREGMPTLAAVDEAGRSIRRVAD